MFEGKGEGMEGRAGERYLDTTVIAFSTK